MLAFCRTTMIIIRGHVADVNNYFQKFQIFFRKF